MSPKAGLIFAAVSSFIPSSVGRVDPMPRGHAPMRLSECLLAVGQRRFPRSYAKDFSSLGVYDIITMTHKR